MLQFQSTSDVRREIIRALVDLDRSATYDELATVCFRRSLIDGTRRSVFRTVTFEASEMVRDGVLQSEFHNETFCLEISDVLTAMALVTPD